MSRGVLAVNIAPETICSHSFIAYIDKNLNVRDYFTADFQIEIPELPAKTRLQDSNLPSKDIMNLDLIKLNLSATLLAKILHSIFMKTPVVILIEVPFLKEHIRNFFKYITRDSFETDIEIITEQEYKKDKKKFKHSMIFQENKIVNNYKKLIDPKKLRVEKQIINQFLSELNLGVSYILLKNEIYKAYQLSKEIVDYIEDQGGKLEIHRDSSFKDSMLSAILDEVLDKNKYLTKIFTDYLNEKFEIKIQKSYLAFLFEIVENYFSIALKQTIKV